MTHFICDAKMISFLNPAYTGSGLFCQSGVFSVSGTREDFRHAKIPPKTEVSDGILCPTGCCTGSYQKPAEVKKLSKLLEFTLNQNDAKVFLQAGSANRRVLRWKDARVELYI